MKKKTGRCTWLEYKCRKCGQVISKQEYEESDAIWESVYFLNSTDAELKELSRLSGTQLLRRANLYDFHRCPDGSMGVCDLVGYEKEIELPYKRGSIVQPTTEEAIPP